MLWAFLIQEAPRDIHWERAKQLQNNMYTGSYKNVKIQLVFFALAVMTKLNWSIKEDTLVQVV